MCDGDDDAWVSLGAIAAQVVEKAASTRREDRADTASCHDEGRSAVILEWKARPRRDGSRSGGDDRRKTAFKDDDWNNASLVTLVAPARLRR